MFLIFYGFGFLTLCITSAVSIDCEISTNGIKKCSGVGSYYNITSDECVCSDGFWGTSCQYGRLLHTTDSGRIIDSEENYFCDSKYMYLIDSGSLNVPVQIHLEDFATECSWDYLYIYDGSSVYDKQLAALSGSIIKSGAKTQQRTLTAYSGAMYLYFYSDANKVDRGFNISYRVGKCESSFCNFHGICAEPNLCTCENEWGGKNCEKRLSCTDEIDIFTAKSSCSSTLTSNRYTIEGRASHAVASKGSKMWVYGGMSFSDVSNLIMYDMITDTWVEVNAPKLGEIYDHSMVFYADHLYVYGGFRNKKISTDLLRYSISTNSWNNLSISGMQQIGVSGHASVEILGEMYIFFGYSDDGYPINKVQTVKLDPPYKWSVVYTTGAFVNGRYGHTATYDRITDSVYLYGGRKGDNSMTGLLLFDRQLSRWSKLEERIEFSKMLHSTSIIGRNLVAFGGNFISPNGAGEKCFMNELVAYNIDCHDLITMGTSIQDKLANRNVYGHSSVVYNSTLYIFGGFEGSFRNNMFKIKMESDCSQYPDKTTCLTAPFLAGCVWQIDNKKCVVKTEFDPVSSIEQQHCAEVTMKCSYNNCFDCAGYIDCAWSKTYSKCISKINNTADVTDTSQCDDYDRKKCFTYGDCKTCNVVPTCYWENATDTCSPTKDSTYVSRSCSTDKVSRQTCGSYDQCLSCNADKDCMWCESQNLCVHRNSYSIQFPYGQCLEWVAKTCKDVKCDLQENCWSCQQLAECGWCADPSNTGLGKCYKGGQNGPINGTCVKSRWHFIEKCPVCSCNGHSTCVNGTDHCEKCYNNVIGKHCNQCTHGWYGNPANNGTCNKKCECNGHLRSCDLDGMCSCNMQGATGDHCERCSSELSAIYHGNATDGGQCYLELSVGYMYTRNFTKVSYAGFAAIPDSQKKNFKFSITRISGAYGYLNLSLYYENGKSTYIAIAKPLESYQIIVEESDYDYDGQVPVQLRAFVYGWAENEHFACRLSYSHTPDQFNLIHFLIMFLVCFCSLLVLLIVLWKAKQRYDLYLLRRRARHEHEERINRPFKNITLQFDLNMSKEKISPTQIACNQLSSCNLAVATYIVQLPTPNGCTPQGSSGMCLASTLITSPIKHQLNIQEKLSKHRKKKKRNTEVVV